MFSSGERRMPVGVTSASREGERATATEREDESVVGPAELGWRALRVGKSTEAVSPPTKTRPPSKAMGLPLSQPEPPKVTE
jgi:hypothetical protein